MIDDVYLKVRQKLDDALANLPRCRVRIDAVKVGMFLARLSPKGEGGFAFATTIQDHQRFHRWCGKLDSNGKPWTRQRVRSCRDALVKVGYLEQANLDTVCYFHEASQSLRDTPNRFRFGAEYGAILASPPSETPSDLPTLASIPDNAPALTPTINGLRYLDKAPLVVVVSNVVVLGRRRSDILTAKLARREVERDQHKLDLAQPPISPLAGLMLSAAALHRFANPL